MKTITTHEELIKLHGAKVTCKINGVFIDDAKISVDSIRWVYVCQNIQIGGTADDKLGYQYSWCIGGTYEKYNAGVTEITLVDSNSLKSKPTIITVQPEIKRYSDSSTEYTKETVKFKGTTYTHAEWKDFVKEVKLTDRRLLTVFKEK